jgi:hypothetical protein
MTLLLKEKEPLPFFAFSASFAVQVFAPQPANGNGNGANRKGRKERRESPSLFFKEPAFAVLCVLDVLCG